MRIAFCITGQSRHLEKCYQSWYNIFGSWGQIDTFFHLWDFETAPLSTSDNTVRLLSDKEKTEIVEILKPKNFLFESKYHINLTDLDFEIKCPVPFWSAPQFVSLEKCANLKRCYELENGFTYDIVIKLRTDIFFNSNFVQSYAPYYLSTGWVNNLKPSTIYSIHSSNAGPTIRLSDMFFLSDSLTFDHISLFFKSFRYLDLASILFVDHNGYSPEHYFYYFLHSVGIKNHPLPDIDIRLYRSAEYKNTKELGGHEIHF